MTETTNDTNSGHFDDAEREDVKRDPNVRDRAAILSDIEQAEAEVAALADPPQQRLERYRLELDSYNSENPSEVPPTNYEAN